MGAGREGLKILPKIKAFSQSLKTGGKGIVRGAAKVGAFGLGALAGSGSSPNSLVSGNNVSFGTAGSAARSGMAGGGSLPSIRAASKPSTNQSMNVNQLLVVAIGYLASIDQTLKNRLETTRSIFMQQQMVAREIGVEAQERNAGGRLGAFGERVQSGTDSLLSALALPAALAAATAFASRDEMTSTGKTVGERIVEGAVFGTAAMLVSRLLFRRLARVRGARRAMAQARAAQRAGFAERQAVRRADINQRASNIRLTNAQVQQQLLDPKVQQSLRNQGYTQRANGKWEKAGRVLSKEELRTAVTRGLATAEARVGARVVEQAAVKGTAAAARTAGKAAASKIPFGIGTIISFGFAYDYATKGEWGKAALTALGGLASFVPGYGTAGAIALDSIVVGWEVYDEMNPPDTPDSALERYQAPRGVTPTNTPGGNGGRNNRSYALGRRQTATGGGKKSVEELVRIALEAGFSRGEASVMAAIAAAESGGDPTIDTVRSGLDPNMRREYSIGLWQINYKVHQNWLRSELGITDPEQLRDPATNARAARAVKEKQGLGAWATYTSGAYQPYYLRAQEAANNTDNQPPEQRKETPPPAADAERNKTASILPSQLTPSFLSQESVRDTRLAQLQPTISSIPRRSETPTPKESVPLPVFYDDSNFKRTVLHAYA